MNIAFRHHRLSLRARFLVPALMVVLLAGCAARRPAPVSDARPPVSVNVPVVTTPADQSAMEPAKPAETVKLHTVQRGDTLVSIALQNGLDYRELAAWNNIENPNVIRVGDNLRLTSPDAAAVTTTALKPGEPVAAPLILTPTPGPSSALEARPTNSAQMKVEPKAGRVPYTDQAYARLSNEAAAGAAASAQSLTAGPVVVSPSATPVPSVAAGPAVAATANDSIDWTWPVKGKVSGTFTDLSKGIDIPGARGTAILASAPGKVIYNKSGLRGYGRVVIIKHNDNWLSAYAHNEKVLVAEDEIVKKGQKIAEMGSSDTDSVKLHFEIRNKGKPVDPLKFLPPQ